MEGQQCLLIHFAVAYLLARDGCPPSVPEALELASAWRAPQLTALAEGILQHSWQPVGPGTLPTTTTSDDAADSGGLWHR